MLRGDNAAKLGYTHYSESAESIRTLRFGITADSDLRPTAPAVPAVMGI